MISNIVQKSTMKLLAAGTFIVTVFLLTTSNSDPVNVTKLFVLGGVGISALFISIIFGRRYLWKNFKSALVAAFLMISTIMSSSFFSAAPMEQTVYGAYGRNTGALTYLLFSFLFISSLLISNSKHIEKIIYALFAAGVVNILYCGWVLLFGDFIGWNNPYGNILGLFGNPDFISAFLGMFIAASSAYLFAKDTGLLAKIGLGFASVVAFFEIVKSHAIQGIVVTLGGITITIFYLIFTKFKNKYVTITYLGLVTTLGILGILGTLQKGPLSFVYKRSVSLRGSYWHAGLEMGMQKPFTGVGLDTYGDWYRRARPPVALIDMPGVNVMSNVSHNVFIDFFASGGFPMVTSYIFLTLLGLISVVKVTKRLTKFDPIFVALVSTWLCYEVQSIISINQIGLAIWGWLFTGLLIGYERATANSSNQSLLKQKSSKKVDTQVITPGLISSVGFVVGLLIAFPPINADAKWFSATNSRSLVNIESALQPSFFNPADSYKYSSAVNLLQSSNLTDLALKYARIAVKFNSDHFDAWKQLYLLQNSTADEKLRALSNMKRLDPLNPDVTSTK
jgi:hypothetical protein